MPWATNTRRPVFDCTKSEKELGLVYRGLDTSVVDMARRCLELEVLGMHA